MPRQRLRSKTSPLALIGRLLVLVLALALIFYGAMLVLLALKVGAGTIDDISAHRRILTTLGDIKATDLGDPLRYALAGGGVLAVLVFGYLALKEFPRPYLARHDLELENVERGVVTVEPRAIERVAEAAAGGHASVAGVTGRYGGDDLAVDVTVLRASDVAGTLREVQRLVVEALQVHDLPVVPVNLTLTGFESRTTRELQ